MAVELAVREDNDRPPLVHTPMVRSQASWWQRALELALCASCIGLTVMTFWARSSWLIVFDAMRKELRDSNEPWTNTDSVQFRAAFEDGLLLSKVGSIIIGFYIGRRSKRTAGLLVQAAFIIGQCGLYWGARAEDFYWPIMISHSVWGSFITESCNSALWIIDSFSPQTGRLIPSLLNSASDFAFIVPELCRAQIERGRLPAKFALLPTQIVALLLMLGVWRVYPKTVHAHRRGSMHDIVPMHHLEKEDASVMLQISRVPFAHLKLSQVILHPIFMISTIAFATSFASKLNLINYDYHRLSLIQDADAEFISYWTKTNSVIMSCVGIPAGITLSLLCAVTPVFWLVIFGHLSFLVAISASIISLKFPANHQLGNLCLYLVSIGYALGKGFMMSGFYVATTSYFGVHDISRLVSSAMIVVLIWTKSVSLLFTPIDGVQTIQDYSHLFSKLLYVHIAVLTLLVIISIKEGWKIQTLK